MICQTCQNENPSEARYCLKCGATLIQHCARCQVELPSGSHFCMHCGQPVGPVSVSEEARLARLAAAAPLPLVEKVRAAAHLAGERRTVTSVFVDIVGSTTLAEQMDEAEWVAMIGAAWDRFYPVVYHYEGTIAQLLGDTLLAFFGAPVAHEDDPVRAVRAALDILEVAGNYAQEVQQRYGVEFRVRIGLNSGPVIVGPVGSDLRYQYTAMGGAVNLAAELQAAAEPMTILISEDTYRFIEPYFECAAWGAIDVREMAQPQRVYRVLASRAVPGKARGLSTAGLDSPMVGRDAELAALTQLCEAVRAGLGRAVLVVGEPGLGKTRLIAEWRAAVENMEHDLQPRWAEGRCLSYGQGLAYHLLIDLVRDLAGISEAAEEPEARTVLMAFTRDLFGDEQMDVYPFLAHLLVLHLEGEMRDRVERLDPQALQTRYLAAIRRVLQVLSQRRPLLLVVEDLHWADPSSVELLIRLLPMSSSAPLLFCMVTRPERDAPGWRMVTSAREMMGGSLTEISLQALSDQDSRQLVANLLRLEALPEETRTLILRKAEGNPFFVEEVIRMLIDRGAIVEREGQWMVGEELEQIEIPDNLQGLLLARIDRLPDDVKHTLRVASVIGRQFPVRVLEHVLGEEEGR